MKKIVCIIIFAIASFTLNATAQTVDSAKKHAPLYLQKKLNTDAQTAITVQGILDNYRAQVKTITTNINLSDAQKQLEMQQAMITKNKQLKEVLTDEQLKILIPKAELTRVAKSSDQKQPH